MKRKYEEENGITDAGGGGGAKAKKSKKSTSNTIKQNHGGVSIRPVTATVTTLVAASNQNQSLGQTFSTMANGAYYTATIQPQQHNWSSAGNINRQHQHQMHNVS